MRFCGHPLPVIHIQPQPFNLRTAKQRPGMKSKSQGDGLHPEFCRPLPKFTCPMIPTLGELLAASGPSFRICPWLAPGSSQSQCLCKTSIGYLTFNSWGCLSLGTLNGNLYVLRGSGLGHAGLRLQLHLPDFISMLFTHRYLDPKP